MLQPRLGVLANGTSKFSHTVPQFARNEAFAWLDTSVAGTRHLRTMVGDAGGKGVALAIELGRICVLCSASCEPCSVADLSLCLDTDALTVHVRASEAEEADVLSAC